MVRHSLNYIVIYRVVDKELQDNTKDQLLMCADVLIAFHRPGKYNIRLYGPFKYEVGQYDIAAHVLKNRYGNVGIHWYTAEYHTMTLKEIDEPKHEVPRTGSRYAPR